MSKSKAPVQFTLDDGSTWDPGAETLPLVVIKTVEFLKKLEFGKLISKRTLCQRVGVSHSHISRFIPVPPLSTMRVRPSYSGGYYFGSPKTIAAWRKQKS